MRPTTAAAIAALLFAVDARPQDAPSVSEAEFLALVDDSHPAVASLRASLGEAEAAAIGARTLLDPELGSSLESPAGATRQLDVTLSWQPPRPGRRRLLVTSAEAGVDAARAALVLDLTVVLQRARAVFADWAVATARAERLALLAAEVDRLARRERRRADSGEASGLDARRIALAAVEASGELARAEAERRSASELARAWRPDLSPRARPQLPPLPVLPPSVPSATLHPRVAALTSELEAARADERVAGKITELPELLAGWQRQDLAGETFDGPIVGLSWPLPLLDRHRAERMTARARVEALEARLLLTDRETTATRAAAMAAYEELRRAASETSEAAAGAPAIVVAAAAAFQAGEADLTDLLETLRSATAVEVRALELHAAALAAHRDVELASLSGPAPGGPR
jgi:outer membrane protein TolC